MIRQVEVGVVERVKHLGAQLNTALLLPNDVLQGGERNVDISGAEQIVAADVAELAGRATNAHGLNHMVGIPTCVGATQPGFAATGPDTSGFNTRNFNSPPQG